MIKEFLDFFKQSTKVGNTASRFSTSNPASSYYYKVHFISTFIIWFINHIHIMFFCKRLLAVCAFKKIVYKDSSSSRCQITNFSCNFAHFFGKYCSVLFEIVLASRANGVYFFVMLFMFSDGKCMHSLAHSLACQMNVSENHFTKGNFYLK